MKKVDISTSTSSSPISSSGSSGSSGSIGSFKDSTAGGRESSRSFLKQCADNVPTFVGKIVVLGTRSDRDLFRRSIQRDLDRSDIQMWIAEERTELNIWLPDITLENTFESVSYMADGQCLLVFSGRDWKAEIFTMWMKLIKPTKKKKALILLTHKSALQQGKEVFQHYGKVAEVILLPGLKKGQCRTVQSALVRHMKELNMLTDMRLSNRILSQIVSLTRVNFFMSKLYLTQSYQEITHTTQEPDLTELMKEFYAAGYGLRPLSTELEKYQLICVEPRITNFLTDALKKNGLKHGLVAHRQLDEFIAEFYNNSTPLNHTIDANKKDVLFQLLKLNEYILPWKIAGTYELLPNTQYYLSPIFLEEVTVDDLASKLASFKLVSQIKYSCASFPFAFRYRVFGFLFQFCQSEYLKTKPPLSSNSYMSEFLMKHFHAYRIAEQDCYRVYYRPNSTSLYIVTVNGFSLLIEYYGLSSGANVNDQVATSNTIAKFSSSVSQFLADIYGKIFKELGFCKCSTGVELSTLVDLCYAKKKLDYQCPHCNQTSLIADICPILCFPKDLQFVEDDVLLDKTLGEGSFGIVREGLMSLSFEKIAVKSFLGETKVAEFLKEGRLMENLQSPYIIKLLGYITDKFALMLELAPKGTLGHHLYSEEVMGAEIKIKCCLDIARGLDYLQSASVPIVHRDLRSFNIFVMSLNPQDEVCVKIGDFGLSCTSFIPLNEILATWQWLAPEIIDGTYYNESSDIYSFAMVVYEIFNRTLPFSDMNDYIVKSELVVKDHQDTASLEADGYVVRGNVAIKEEFLIQAIKRDIIELRLRPTVPDDWNSDLNLILQSCWDPDPTRRPSSKILVTFFQQQLHLARHPQDSKYDHRVMSKTTSKHSFEDMMMLIQQTRDWNPVMTENQKLLDARCKKPSRIIIDSYGGKFETRPKVMFSTESSSSSKNSTESFIDKDSSVL